MITALSSVCIYVNDQDKAKAFYTDKLGFEVHTDAPMGESRWIAVAPPGAQTEVILYKLDSNWEHYREVLGKSQSLSFAVDDIAATAADLKAKGVHITQEPTTEFWGTYMMILDQDNNGLLLVEQAK
jgi:lactoylglutathione lyase